MDDSRENSVHELWNEMALRWVESAGTHKEQSEHKNTLLKSDRIPSDAC
jgi:hypothetical protein